MRGTDAGYAATSGGTLTLSNIGGASRSVPLLRERRVVLPLSSGGTTAKSYVSRVVECVVLRDYVLVPFSPSLPVFFSLAPQRQRNRDRDTETETETETEREREDCVVLTGLCWYLECC
eukprot:2462040-Rhodomonas_salina.1